MPLETLKISRFRNIEAAELNFSPRLNVISGANAAGKTSLLEAIYFLGRARSFRTSHLDRLVQSGAAGFELFGRVTREGRSSLPVGMARQGRSLRIRMGGEDVRRLSQLAGRFPFQVVAGDLHKLLEEGPRHRRRFMDWGLFHVEPGYAEQWRRYQRALKQRNAALRSRRPLAQIQAWDPELVEAGEQLDQLRRDYLQGLQAHLARELATLLPEHAAARLVYRPGLPAGRDLASCLHELAGRDLETGFTRHGPHRGDFQLRSGDADLLPQLSRGQQKLAVVALRLAQAALGAELRGYRSLFLVDDLGAELDAENQHKVLDRLAASGAQVFLTLIDPSALADRSDTERCMFHVEHGEVREVV